MSLALAILFVLRILALVGSIVGFYYTTKVDWRKSSLAWNISAVFLWVSSLF